MRPRLLLRLLVVAVAINNARGRKCPGLGCIAHGTVSNTQGPFLKDSVVTYRCYEGYVLKGDEERKCMGNGQWSGTEPRCEEKQGVMCGAERCHRYADCRDKKCKCNDNFRGDGRNCQAKGCPRPGCFANGQHSGHQDYFTKDNKITYQCHSGYRLIGQKERTCMKEGQWSGKEPRCEKGKQRPQRPKQKMRKCMKPKDPPNGSIRSSDESYKVGTVITYECQAPLVLKGNAQRTCQYDKKWSGKVPVCKAAKKKTCPKPGEIAHGTVTKKKRFVAGNKIKYTCAEGYVLSGNAERTCQASGHWTGSDPRCEVPDPCRKKHGHRCHRHARCEKPEGERDHRCVCNDGYQGDGVRCVVRQKSECEKRIHQRCHKFAECIKNSKGKYECRCRPGYSGGGVTCQEIVCHKPPGISDGKLETHQEKFIPGNVVSYRCNQGYKLGGKGQRTCMDDGSWSDDNPQCQRG